MKLSELIAFCIAAQDIAKESHGNADPEVALCFESSVYNEGFDWKSTEGISDIRLVSDWALPGESVITNETEKSVKFVIFYDNHFNLADSSIEETPKPVVATPKAERPALGVGQKWKSTTGKIVEVERYDSYGPEDREPFYCSDGYWYTLEGKAYMDTKDETTLFSTLEELLED